MKNGDMRAEAVYRLRYGNVEAAVWKNETATGPRYNVTLARVYKDGDEWKRSNSFGEDELLRAARAANDAYTFLQSLKREERQQERRDEATESNGAAHGQ